MNRWLPREILADAIRAHSDEPGLAVPLSMVVELWIMAVSRRDKIFVVYATVA